MQITLHLTNKCNMRCRYCYVDHSGLKVMTSATARKAVDLTVKLSEGKTAGISFFGGEPLLYKDLIYETVEYCRFLKTNYGPHFYLKMTTNGLLLDDAFLDYADKESIFIALSIDGVSEAHDACRVDSAGQGTHLRVSETAKKLLKRQIHSPALMVIRPEIVRYFYDSVDYLFHLGFRYIICSLDYAAEWNEKSLSELKRQYHHLAQWYYEHTLKEDKFYLSPFEAKIASHIKEGDWCQERCELGKNNISVAADGTLYPCVQFVGDDSYAIGHAETGIDEKKILSLFEVNSTEKSECASCSVRSRCLHTCGCLNRQVTGRIDRVAPSLCAHERILLPIADKVAAKLYKKRSGMFIQKHYNEMYPFISAVEDASTRSNESQNIVY